MVFFIVSDDMYNAKNGEWYHSKFMKKCYLTIGGDSAASISLLAEKWRMARLQIYLKNHWQVKAKNQSMQNWCLHFFNVSDRGQHFDANLFDISDIGPHLFVGGKAKFTHGIDVEDARDGTDDSSDSGRNTRGDCNDVGNVQWHYWFLICFV